MGTLYDYIKWRGDLTFSEAPLNEVDSLIFSLLSYLDLKGIVPEVLADGSVPIKAAANSFFAKNPDYKKISMGLIVPKEIILLFRALKDTKRFRNVNMRAHVNVIDQEREMQFSATTFFPGDGSAVIAFRGTDDTLVGWKENLKMSFLPFVPAQRAALEYLTEIANACKEDLVLTGHSKGGNLAVYAGVKCESKIQKRLLRIWNHDGPGFQQDFMHSDEYFKVRPLIRTLLPQASFVGMLLVHEEKYTVIKSRQPGIWQHNGLNWEVMGGSFVHLPTISEESLRTDKTLNEWINMMTPEQREVFVESLYYVLTADNNTTLTDVSAAGMRWLAKSKELDPHVRKTVQEVLGALFNVNAKNIFGDIFPKNAKK